MTGGEAGPGWLDARMAPWRPGPADWARIVLRGGTIVVLCGIGLPVLLVLRLAEVVFRGDRRPWSPQVPRAFSRAVLAVMGLRLDRQGQPMRQPGALVANHGGWMDIFVLNAGVGLFFVAKAEVAGWAVIGWLARIAGTLFITRKGSEAGVQAALLDARLRAGHRLLFFPEGTSTDSRRVLPFKSTLFAAFFRPGLAEVLHLQPVSVVYHAPPGADLRFYGWWGDMEFGPHFLQVLAQPRQGRAEVIFHPPVAVATFADRKALSAHCERAVRSGHDRALAADQPSGASSA